MKILIDNGHGSDTPGKRSPDGRFLEYLFNREIATRIVNGLKAEGYDAELLVPELYDVPLKERVCRINAYCMTLGRQNVIVVSIHSNASGNGSKWMKAQGWSCYTSKGDTKSDELADCLCNEALKTFTGRRLRTDLSDGDQDFEEDFYILKYSKSIAVLSESFFYDNVDDLRYLESSEGKAAIVRTHIEGLRSYLQQESTEHQNNR